MRCWTASLLVLLIAVACGCPPTVPTIATAGPAPTEPAPPPESSTSTTTPATTTGTAEPAEDAAPEGPEAAALRAWLAAHPDDVPGVIGLPGLFLVVLRRPADATLCIVTDPADDGPAIAPRCVRTGVAIDDLRLLAVERRTWLAFAGGLYMIGDDGALEPRARAPRGRWWDLRRSKVPAPRRARSGSVTLHEIAADDLPLGALVELDPEPLDSAADAAWTSDALLCLRVDGVWRCAPPEGLGEPLPGHLRVLAPVRGSTRAVVPIEVSRCLGGSELSECTHELHLLDVAGPTWSFAASLPLGAEIDERLRERDDDDGGARVVGSTESYRRRYAVEAPLCVRFTAIERAAEAYAHHFRDRGQDRSKRRSLPPTTRIAPPPADLPRRASEIDPYTDPADLTGLWQVRGERWVPVERCDP